MCIAPIYLLNPYYKNSRGISNDGKHISTKGRFDYVHDTIHQYVSVPCGKCSQCISMRQNFYVQRIQMESIRSEIFYFTLTYANRALKYTNKCDVSLPYPEFSDIQNMFKRLRKRLPHSILTFVVSEFGSKKHRPHYHGFIAVFKDDIKKFYRGSHLYCEKILYRYVLEEWKRNLSTSTKCPRWMKLCDYIVKGKKRTYDLHWVEPIIDHDNDTSYYVTKYLLQPDEYIGKLLRKLNAMRHYDSFSDCPRFSDDDYKEVISQLKPRAVMSKKFGDYRDSEISKYIRKCICSNKTIPQYIDINTGKTMLLSPYYRNLVDSSFYFDRWWSYLFLIQRKNLSDLGFDTYNPEYLDEVTVHDLNCQSHKARKKDFHLKKVKSLLNRKK